MEAVGGAMAVVFLYQITFFTTKHNSIGGGSGGGSQQREVADGADVVFTDTAYRS